MDQLKEIDFESDDFRDIIAKDARFHARAYALLMDVVHYVCSSDKQHATGEDILDEFKERALDQYGPLAYTVLTEWGVKCTEDVGEMMFNLVEGHRVQRGENDTAEAFVNGYDFRETFLAPYQT